MTLLDTALRGALRPASVAPPAGRMPSVLVAGAGGALGSAVLEALLGSGRTSWVTVLSRQPIKVVTPGLRLRSIDAPRIGPAAASEPEPAADIGLVILDRPRHSNGRDDAFWLPQPGDLRPLAQAWHHEGVASLVVLWPHDAARWPQALREGLASLDEQAVASLAWRQFAIVRPAEPPRAEVTSGLQRVAQAVLAQLRLMVPTAQQPVRSSSLAALVADLVTVLPAARQGARVLPADLVWQAVQADDRRQWLEAWWSGDPLPTRIARPRRL
jgi:hypothetical protein